MIHRWAAKTRIDFHNEAIMRESAQEEETHASKSNRPAASARFSRQVRPDVPNQ
jgi:hypothetical protein